MKKLLSSSLQLLAIVGVLLTLAMTVSEPLRAQLIYGNTFPFWNVNGPLTVTGTTTLSGSTTLTGATALTGGTAITGDTSGNNAATGIVGEVLTGSQSLASAVSLTTNTPKGSQCVSLTAGDWDAQGNAQFSSSAATFSTVVVGLTTNALSNVYAPDGQYTRNAFTGTTVSGASMIAATTPIVQLSPTTTTVYCVNAQNGFSAGAMSLYGTIRARRMR